MGVFFIYILKSSVCLVLFYLFFRLLLSKETFHRFNRMALLGVLFFSLLIPCIEVTTRHQVEVQQAVLSIEQLLLMAELEATPANVGAVQETSAISWVQVVLLVYLAGILFLACRNIYSLICLFRLIHSGKHEKLEKGVTLVVHNQEIAPFSWMKYIVISRKDLEENGREILIHEMAHIHHRHSVDLLVADICIFFQWFNPSAWLLKQELQNVHEYEADETVINEGVNAKEYQLLLIKKAVGTRLYSMANSFNHSKLKKRITMMLKERDSGLFRSLFHNGQVSETWHRHQRKDRRIVENRIKDRSDRNIRRILIFAVLAVGIYIFTQLTGRTGMQNRYDAQYLGMFDTVTSIVAYTKDQHTFNSIAEEFHQELERYNRLYDIYKDYDDINNIKTINDNAGIQPVQVDEDIIDMLEEAVELYELTEGRINVAMGSVLSIWHDHREEGRETPDKASLPQMEELKKAAEHTDIYSKML